MSTHRNENNPAYIAFFAPVFLMMSVPVRILIKKYRIPIPQDAVLFVITSLIGFVIMFTPSLRQYHHIASMPPRHYIAIFVPIILFNRIYNAEHYTFVKCLPQSILLATFGAGMHMLALMLIFKSILHTDWTLSMSIIAAVACTPISPAAAIIRLQELEKHKHLSTIIAGENLLTFSLMLMIFEIYLGYSEGFVHMWYQFVSILIRYLTISIVVGCIIGKITTILLYYLYNEPNSAMSISVAMTFITYYLVEFLFASSGPIAVICMGYYVVIKRHRLSAEVDTTISDFWSYFAYMCGVISLNCGVLALIRYSCFYFAIKNLYGGVILYFSSNILRFLIFVFISPLLNLYTYKFNLKCLIALAWAGGKGLPNIAITLLLMSNETTFKFSQSFVTELVIFCFLSTTINMGTLRLLLELIGLTDLSSIRKTNMNHCMHFIMEKRECIIHTLKINRYFSDANWSLTREDTILKHPYKGKAVIDFESDKESEAITRQATINCPDCSKEIPFEMSEEDQEELTREARIKILKAKKVSTIKQYENGFIDKNCLQVLTLNFEILIGFTEKNKRSKPIINLEKIMKRDHLLDKLRNFIMKKVLTRNISDPPPTTLPFRRFSFFVVNHAGYEYVIVIVLITLSIAFMLTRKNYVHFYFVCTINTLIFIGDIILKMAALSKVSIANGIKNYFRNYINIVDFICVAANCLDVSIMTILLFMNIQQRTWFLSLIFGCVRYYRLYPAIQLLFPNLIHAINRTMDTKVCFGYDLATSMVSSCDEVLNNLKHTIDVRVIRIALYKELLDERRNMIKLMEEVQREKPWIAITVKTKQAIRSTLRSMVESLNEMKVQGFVDNTEYTIIFKEIFERQKFLRTLKFVQPSPPKIIFNEISWMVNDPKIIEYLYNNVEKVTWEAEQIVCKNGKYSEGVYIVLSGLLRLKYSPNENVLKKLNTLGTLPIVDFISTLDFDSKMQDNIMSGNSIGELSVLTGRPYSCSIVADSFCRAFLLKTEVIKNAMRLNAHPLTGLEARMWKCTTINLAVAILIDLPLYQSFTQEQIKFKLERSFMPNLSCYKMFVISDLMDDVILIEGVASDYNSGEVFIAPTAIPRTIQKLILPRSSYLALEERVETKLLIVPVGETQAYDIMEAEEEVAELVTLPSSKCLLHTVQDRHWQQKKPFVRKKALDEILTIESFASIDNRTSDEKFEVIEPGVYRHFSLVPTSNYSEHLLLQNKRLEEGPEENIQDLEKKVI